MRLYDSNIPSGNAYKVHLLLSLLGHRYETTELDILATPSETRRPEFLKINPNGRIPVLQLNDGTVLPESNAILYYLADGTRYLPSSRLGRAQAMQWMFFEQYSHEPYVAVLKFWSYWGGLDRCRAEDVERWKARGQAALDVMERHLTGREYFVDTFSIADIALYAYTHGAEPVGFRIGPAVRGWLARVAAQPGHVSIKRDPAGKAP